MKYYNQKTRCRYNHIHDSKAEASRCEELHLLWQAGEISELKQQVEYIIIESGKFQKYGMKNEVMAKYKCDFDYYDKSGQHIVEDVKSKATAEDTTYILKRKLFKKIWCKPAGDIIFFENIVQKAGKKK